MKCNLCHSDSQLLINFGNFPIAHHYLKEQAQKESKYPFELAFCNHCNHVFIANPISPKVLYENYITLSDWKHEPDIMRLLELIQTYVANKNAKILEIGCNDGKFLNLLKATGYANTVGIEPTGDAFLSANKKGIEVIRGFFNAETAKKYNDAYGKCDFLVIRQVLEHISDLKHFASMMEKVLSPGAFILIEVPDFETCVTNSDYTLWEEHINYFTHETLSYFLSKINVDMLGYEKFLFSGTCFRVIGKLSNIAGNKKYQKNTLMMEHIASYGEKWPKFTSKIDTFLSELKAAGKKIALYGAGNRTAAFVNFNNIAQYIDFVADDQFEKQTLFMPGSALQILPSEQLVAQNIDIVLMGVNSESEVHVMKKHADSIKNGVIFYSILPPSDFLPSFWKDFNTIESVNVI